MEKRGVITAASRALREALECSEDSRGLAEGVDPCYRTASIFVKNKTWVKLDTTECKAYFLRDRIPSGLYPRLEAYTSLMERAMADRQS